MATKPLFGKTPNTGTARSGASAHITLLSLTGLTLLLTAGASGAVVTEISCRPGATIAACPAYLYRSTDSGVTVAPVRSRTIAAGTVSTSLAPADTDFGYSESAPLRLRASERLYVGHATTVLVDWFAQGLDL